MEVAAYFVLAAWLSQLFWWVFFRRVQGLVKVKPLYFFSNSAYPFLAAINVVKPQLLFWGMYRWDPDLSGVNGPFRVVRIVPFWFWPRRVFDMLRFPMEWTYKTRQNPEKRIVFLWSKFQPIHFWTSYLCLGEVLIPKIFLGTFMAWHGIIFRIGSWRHGQLMFGNVYQPPSDKLLLKKRARSGACLTSKPRGFVDFCSLPMRLETAGQASGGGGVAVDVFQEPFFW